MRKYDEICASIGYDRRAKAPELTYCWIGYDQGNVIKCKSQFEASKYTLNERVVDPESKEAHDKFFMNIREKEAIASDMFHNELRQEYQNLSDNIFNFCFSEAYNRGHSAGYDEIANMMIDVVNFAENVRAVV